MANEPKRGIEEIVAADGRYPFEAVQFLREGLNHTVAKLYPETTDESGRRHISGAQLCEGLRQLASERWGLLAQSVLSRWNIRSTRDFGEMVFLLVEHDWLQKQPEDTIEDFDNVYDFREAFGRDFEASWDNR